MSDYIFGKNNIIELLTDGRRNVNKIILSKGLHNDNKIDKILELAKEKGIVYQFVPKEKFQQFNEFSHQGIVAYVAPIEYVELEDFLAKEKQYKKVVILDGVEDPHNVGSITRTAVCAGFDAIIIPSRRSSIINSTVEKSSAGATNHIDIIMVNSLQATISKLKDSDFWIIASDASAKDNYYEIDYCDMNFAIVMGSEKTGISNSTLKNSDFVVKIPMYNDFDSLNVANAASIIIYESIKQIRQKSNLIV